MSIKVNLEIASAPGAPDASIENFQWYLTEVGGTPVSPLAGDRQPHILLDRAEGQVKGFSSAIPHSTPPTT